MPRELFQLDSFVPGPACFQTELPQGLDKIPSTSENPPDLTSQPVRASQNCDRRQACLKSATFEITPSDIPPNGFRNHVNGHPSQPPHHAAAVCGAFATVVQARGADQPSLRRPRVHRAGWGVCFPPTHTHARASPARQFMPKMGSFAQTTWISVRKQKTQFVFPFE